MRSRARGFFVGVFFFSPFLSAGKAFPTSLRLDIASDLCEGEVNVTLRRHVLALAVLNATWERARTT